MRKIDLNMTVRDWCEQARQEYRMSVRLVNCLLHKGIEDIAMRQLCRMTVAQVSDMPYFGQRTMTELVHILARHGLSLEMTGADIKEYEGCVESEPDNIDWERRRWELAMRIFAHDVTFPYAINEADRFVEKYKQSQKHPETPTDETAVEQDKEGINPAASLEKTLRAKLVGKNMKMYLGNTENYRVVKIQEVNYRGVGYTGEMWDIYGPIIRPANEEESLMWAGTFITNQIMSLANEYRLKEFDHENETWSLVCVIEESTKQSLNMEE